MHRLLLITVAIAGQLACSIPVRQARLDPLAAPSAEEERAAAARADPTCAEWLWLAWPGVAQACTGRPAEAATLAALGAAELGTGVALLALTDPPEELDLFGAGGRTVALVAFQDVYVYSMARSALDRQLAQRLPYTPADELHDLVAAPFNVAVMKRPAVWGTTALMLGAAVGVSAALGEPVRPTPWTPPNLFGARPSPALGYPAYAVSSVVLFEHVAIAEEAVFRGVVQSGLVRSLDSEWGGWGVGTLLFGGLHAFNALALPPEQRGDYLLYGLPFITVVGGTIGIVYKAERYALAPPVAVHFWYDTLLSGVAFAADPQHNLFSMRIGGPW